MRITKVRSVKTPVRGTDRSAGIDFFVPDDLMVPHYLKPGESMLIPSGIHAEIPAGYVMIAKEKSGVATKKNLIIGASVVDEDYQGEIHLHVINVGKGGQWINLGEKLVQFILVPVSYTGIEVIDSIDDLYNGTKSERGTGGFGSTGTE